MCYNPDDLLPVCEELDIPLVVSRLVSAKGYLVDTVNLPKQFDYHHNWIYVCTILPTLSCAFLTCSSQSSRRRSRSRSSLHKLM